jgi:Sap, sulfolipid-1-addressing protein
MALVPIALLATASMFWPVLLVVVVIALESGHPLRILVAFYVGGFLAATSVGTALVFVLEDSALMDGSRLPSAPGFDIALGVLALVIAVACRIAYRRRLGDSAASDRGKRSRTNEWIQHLAENGGSLGFAGGVVGSFVPGPFVILGMADIAQLGYSTTATSL